MRSVKPWVVGAVAAVLLGAVVVLLVRAPVPAVSGPSSAALTGPESVPHTHVMTAPSGAPVPVGGLAESAGGYSFVVTGMTPFTFHIQGPDGHPVTKFQIVHDKPLHLIVVRRNLSGYQHLHPALAADGTWTVALSLPPPGPSRAYADFTTGNGTAVVLGVDLPASGSAATSTVDGQLTMTGSLTVGVAEPLLFKAKEPLQPYLGAYGHLTMLRESDLAYLHIHPEPALVDGAAKFWVAAPSAGTFRLYLDYQTGGRVPTAEFHRTDHCKCPQSTYA